MTPATLLLLPFVLAPQDWPQGPGQGGDWRVPASPSGAIEFSVRAGEGVRWRMPLSETGQGGVTMYGDRLFVTTMAPWHEGRVLDEEEAELFRHATEGRRVVGKDLLAHCVDAQSGVLLWSRPMTGLVPSIYSYPFSDATSASPVADAEHVWFTHAGGRLACFTHEGDLVWERTWTPTYDGPFNKQFEPFLVGEGAERVLVTMEPRPAPGAEDPEDHHGRWNVLKGLDPATGRELWSSDDALTQYNAPTLVNRDDGPCALVARGGPHAVPERPVGVSLVRLTGPEAGRSVWRYEDPRGNHEASLQTMAHDERYAYWLLKEPRNALAVLDLETGQEVREISLTRGVQLTEWDEESGELRTRAGVDLEKGVFPARYSLAAAAGHVLFQCYGLAWGKESVGPPWSFARVDPEAGTVAYVEVPSDRDASGALLWRTRGAARPLNSRGIEVTGDDRCRWDGWDWVFNGSPTVAGDLVYWTLSTGLVYVLDAGAAIWDGGALVALNDLGPMDGLWTANSMTIVGDTAYHRTAAELLRLGR